MVRAGRGILAALVAGGTPDVAEGREGRAPVFVIVGGGPPGVETAVDAIVAATAEKLGTRVRLLTGDPDDLGALTADMRKVTVVAI